MMTNEQANELFRQYRKTGDKSVRNKLVENYMYIAEILAKKFAGRGVEYDDLLPPKPSFWAWKNLTPIWATSSRHTSRPRLPA